MDTLVSGENRWDVAMPAKGEPDPEPKGREYINVNATYHYVTGFRPTQVRGKFATVSVSQTKPGLAGLEQDAFAEGGCCLEATNWYYDKGDYRVGLVGYKAGILALRERVVSIPGQVYSYLISVEPSGVRGKIWDANKKLILEEVLSCSNPGYLKECTTFAEYWRYHSGVSGNTWLWLPGEFHYLGYHIIEELYDPNMGWKVARNCLKENSERDTWNIDPYGKSILHIHHRILGKGAYYDDCEVIDNV